MMLAFQTLLALFFATISLSHGINNFKINCAPPNQVSFSGDKCWMLVSIPQKFIEAAQFCRSFGGNLTSIHNAFDNIYLADLAQQYFAHDFYYIGGTNLDDKKNWAWMDGSVMEFTDWGNYEPIDGILNNCLIVATGHGIWHSHDCTTASPFVCEVPEDHSPPPTTAMPPLTTTFQPFTTRPSSDNMTTTFRPISNTTTTLLYNVTVGTTTVESMRTTTTIVSANDTTTPPQGSPTTNVTSGANTTTTTEGPIFVNTSTTADASGGGNTSTPSSFPQNTNANSAPEKDPSSTSKRGGSESSTPFVASGANTNHRIFNSLLTSLAVGKAAEYLPKFTNNAAASSASGKQHPRFKSYRQH